MNQFEDMQAFVRIVEANSITKAAEQMDTAKSALSRRLSELEKRLGVTLLTRTTRSQALTDSGKSYYQQCLRIIEDLAEIESGIRNEHCALAGRVKIAAPLTFGLTHLAPALRKFNEIHPDIHFDVNFNDRKMDLIEDGFDLAIRISDLEDSTLIAKKLTTIRNIICASPGYLNKHGTPKTLKDLDKGHVRLRYSLGADNLHIKIPSVITANNGEYLCQEAIANRGILFSPDFICYKAIRMGQLIPILTDEIVTEEIGAYAIYPQTRHLSQRVRSLVDYLAQYFGEQPYWRVD